MAGDILSFIEEYVVEPFKYTTSDWLKILIGASLLFISVIIYVMLNFIGEILIVLLGPFAIPFLFIMFCIYMVFEVIVDGYYIGVIRSTLKGLDTLPNWINIGRILIDGVLYKVASIALMFLYLVVYFPLILLLVIVKQLLQFISWRDWVLGLVLITVILFITWSIYVPLATVNFAKKGFLGFFDIWGILKKFSFEYLAIWVLYKIVPVIILLPIGICLDILMLIPFVNILVLLLVILLVVIIGPVLGFILEVMFHRAVAKYYRERE